MSTAQQQDESKQTQVQTGVPDRNKLIIKYLEGELKKEKAANAALKSQRDEHLNTVVELRNTIEEMNTPPYKLTDVNEYSEEYKRYYRTNQNNVRNHKTTAVKRASTLETFRGKRESLLTQHHKDRHEIFDLSQKMAVLERQVIADMAADAERKLADELADQVANAVEELQERIAEKQDSIRQGRKRARSLQLGENLQEDVEATRQEPAVVGRYTSMTTVELLNIARGRGHNLPETTPRDAIVAALDAPSPAAVQAVAEATAQATSQAGGATISYSEEEILQMFQSQAPSRASSVTSFYDTLTTEQLQQLADYYVDPASQPTSRAPSPPPLEPIPGTRRLSRQVSPTSALANRLRDALGSDEHMGSA